MRSENKSLAAIVLSILTISKDSIRKSNGFNLLKNLFCLHSSRNEILCQISQKILKVSEIIIAVEKFSN